MIAEPGHQHLRALRLCGCLTALVALMLTGCGSGAAPTSSSTSSPAGRPAATAGSGTTSSTGLRFRAVLVEQAAAPVATVTPNPSASSSGTALPGRSAPAVRLAEPVTASRAKGGVHAEPAVAAAAPTPTDASDPAWVTPEILADLQSLNCSGPPRQDLPDRPLMACSSDGNAKYVLGPAELTGADVTSATAVPEVNSQGATTGNGWMVTLQLSPSGKKRFGDVTRRLAALVGVRNQLGIVVGSVVISAPSIREPITGGMMQITGSFTQASATNLAARIHG